MFDRLALSPWQRFVLWPGGVFMDWLARTWPDVVIVHGIGFTTDSYVFWVGVVSAVFWCSAFIAAGWAVRRCLRLGAGAH